MLLIPLNRGELCKYLPRDAVGAEIGVSPHMNDKSPGVRKMMKAVFCLNPDR